MGILLTILKWLGILILILLAVVLILLLIVLLVPFHYKAVCRVDDPDVHSEFPVSVFKERSDVTAEITWMLGIVKLLVSYPTGDLLLLKIFRKKIRVMKFLKRVSDESAPKEQEEKEEKEEEKETALIERAERSLDRLGRIFDHVDYLFRILTGSCGRRALAKIQKRCENIVFAVLPSRWTLGGTVGLSDPCLNGKVAGACAVLMPVCDEHLQLDTRWEDYQCDLKAEMEGKFRLGVPVKEAIPIVLDKDCRKLFKKLMKARARFASKPPDENNGSIQNGTEQGTVPTDEITKNQQ